MLNNMNVFTGRNFNSLAAIAGAYGKEHQQAEYEAEQAYASFARTLAVMNSEGVEKCPLFIVMQRATDAIAPVERWLQVVEYVRDHAFDFSELELTKAGELRRIAKEEAQFVYKAATNLRTITGNFIDGKMKSQAWDDFRDAESRVCDSATKAS